jgi:hypothetical protein
MKMAVFINKTTQFTGEGLENAGPIFRGEMGKCRKFILGWLIAGTLTRGLEIPSTHSAASQAGAGPWNWVLLINLGCVLCCARHETCRLVQGSF